MAPRGDWWARVKASAVRRKSAEVAVARTLGEEDGSAMPKARSQRQRRRPASRCDMAHAARASVQVLGATDLVLLGVGGSIGAGVFVLTGVAARQLAGPGVVLSYALAAVASLLAGLCYTEFAVELPVAGSAYNYVYVSFGELAAFLVGCDLVLEFTISAAAVARGMSSYCATAVGQAPDAWRVSVGAVQLDLPAAAAVVVESALLAYGIRESSTMNNVVNAVNLACIAFVVVVGAGHASAENFAPFMPFGLGGVFAGASVVFFSFVGFDTVATVAEEVKNPARDLPIGLLGSIGVVAAVYCSMAATIVGMQPYTQIDEDAPFAVAFQRSGLSWAGSVVSVGALTGIVTSLLVSLMGQPRIYLTMARDGLLPPWFAAVHATRRTPLNATVVTGASAAALALLVDVDVLAQLVSIGTLCVFCFVCAGVIARRYCPEDGAPRWPVLRAVAGMAASAAVFSGCMELLPRAGPGLLALAVPALLLFVALAAWLARRPVALMPKRFRVPAAPWLPALGMLATIQLIASLGPVAWARFVVYYALCTAVYVFRTGRAGGAAPAGDAGRGAERDEDDDGVELLPSRGGAAAAEMGAEARPRHTGGDGEPLR